MPIEFYLKAVKRFDGTLRVLEYYKVMVEGAGPDGKPLQTLLEGRVDDDIRHEHPREYAEFEALVNAHQEEMFAKAKAEYVEEK